MSYLQELCTGENNLDTVLETVLDTNLEINLDVVLGKLLLIL